MEVEIDRSREAYTTPAMPAVSPVSAKASVRIPARFTPARRAASALPPIAYMYRPTLVRPSRNVHAASTPKTSSTTQGTPWIGTITPRFVLQSSTIATPPTRTAPILRSVKLGGGATRPARRRLASRRQFHTPKAPTTTSITTQPASGDRLPLAMSLMTQELMGMEPPAPRVL